ncbi:hypothetical protein J2853_004145 [Streptosporangium lutulentum]|uniref:Uncharacterized protein n=1 Tax=Streptosporangium lutulentum TaxID=1461250 RepID=A0ABT9QE39_9ACTN|nr:hypothetical protein [Streptosporangium lutulentum]
MRTGGAGLSVFSNGAAVLNDLGVSLDGAGGRFDRIDALTADGRLRLRSDMAHAAARYGFPSRSAARRKIAARSSNDSARHAGAAFSAASIAALTASAVMGGRRLGGV